MDANIDDGKIELVPTHKEEEEDSTKDPVSETFEILENDQWHKHPGGG